MRRALLSEAELSELQELAAGIPLRVHVDLSGEATIKVGGRTFDDLDQARAHLLALEAAEVTA